MQKVLKAKGNIFAEHGYDMVVLPIDKLFCLYPKRDKIYAMDPKDKKFKEFVFYPKLLKDIKEQGLKNPIMVMKATYDEIAIIIQNTELLTGKEWYKDKDIVNDLPSAYSYQGMAVVDGCNRFWVAKELGYKYISACVHPEADLQKLIHLGRLARWSSPDLYPTIQAEKDFMQKKAERRKREGKEYKWVSPHDPGDEN